MEANLQDFKPETPTAPSVIGFMWNDFSVARGESHFEYDPTRAFVYGENPTRFLLATSSTPAHRIQAVFRGHQHATIPNSMMRRLKAGRGVYRHWQEADSLAHRDAEPAALARIIETGEERRIPSGSVWTFNVAPDSVYGEAVGFDFDTFGILTVAESFEDWRLRVVNQNIRQ
jgi:hypothetical protein